MAEPLQNTGHRQTHLRGHLINEAGDEEADVHRKWGRERFLWSNLGTNNRQRKIAPVHIF
jgi:hypothetical protein